MAEKKNRGGHPPKYSRPEDMQAQIDAYFKDCEGHVLTDKDGQPMRDKFGYPIILDQKPLTVTGLALALGFTSRQALLNYQARPAFRAIVERAKLRIENYAEMRLYDKDGANGAKFNLQNNFRHWDADKAAQEDGGKGPVITIINDIPRVPSVPVDPAADQPAIDVLKPDRGENDG